MSSCWNFGVEIEVIVVPRNFGQPVTESVKIRENLRGWYGELAAAMRNRHLDARESEDRGYRTDPNRAQRWWITWDGSLIRPRWPKENAVPLEAVSPKLSTNMGWEDEIEAFWRAVLAVFYRPRRSLRCGSHVHVSPGEGDFFLEELQAIAFAVIWFNDEVQQCLHTSRRDAPYCKANKEHAQMLRGKSIYTIADMINGTRDPADLVGIVQGWGSGDRATLWNFQNVTARPGHNERRSGTVEFRGGRCLRGRFRTKRWISFAIAFIIMAIKDFPVPLRIPSTRPGIDDFWNKILEAASQQGLAIHLPSYYTTMNEFYTPDIIDSDNDSLASVDNIGDEYTPPSAPDTRSNTPAGSVYEDSG